MWVVKVGNLVVEVLLFFEGKVLDDLLGYWCGLVEWVFDLCDLEVYMVLVLGMG